MEEWRQRHHEASTAMDDREERLDELYEEIEKDLMVSPPAQYFDTLLDSIIGSLGAYLFGEKFNMLYILQTLPQTNNNSLYADLSAS